MSLERRLSEAADRITVAMDALLPRSQGPEGRLLSAMRYAALAGGKRLRSFLTLEVGRLFEADEQALLRAAVAIECVQTSTTVHDDLPCMDDDDLRRGQPTTHVQYDEATALLAGDALAVHAFEILADPATHPDPQMRCLLVLGLARAAGPQGICAGQMIDMLGAQLGDDIATVARMNRLKTGALIEFAVEAGALIGGAPEDARKALVRFANDLGLAYQMTDDLLDAENGPAEAGKVNFVTLLGDDGARERVRLLAAQAKGHLALFGPRATVLTSAVDYVLDRRT